MITKKNRSANLTIYSLETKIHISLINSYAPQVHSFFLWVNEILTEIKLQCEIFFVIMLPD